MTVPCTIFAVLYLLTSYLKVHLLEYYRHEVKCGVTYLIQCRVRFGSES